MFGMSAPVVTWYVCDASAGFARDAMRARSGLLAPVPPTPIATEKTWSAAARNEEISPADGRWLGTVGASGFGRPSDRKMMTCVTSSPFTVERSWSVMLAAPVAMPVLNGVLPFEARPLIAAWIVLAEEVPSTTSLPAVVPP